MTLFTSSFAFVWNENSAAKLQRESEMFIYNGVNPAARSITRNEKSGVDATAFLYLLFIFVNIGNRYDITRIPSSGWMWGLSHLLSFLFKVSAHGIMGTFMLWVATIIILVLSTETHYYQGYVHALCYTCIFPQFHLVQGLLPSIKWVCLCLKLYSTTNLISDQHVL